MPAAVPPTFEPCVRLPCNTQGRDFVVGDLLDRGPQSPTVIEWPNQPWFFSVRGNHEQMVLDHDLGTGEADKHWRNGGAWFYDAYLALRKAIALAVQFLPYVLEIKRPTGCVGIVHAKPALSMLAAVRCLSLNMAGRSDERNGVTNKMKHY